ncbi:MAG: hypothetical protein JJE52_12280 [Acidimicrobiia bacterium]|nr:hypothetical protein [Acidimicrobiia bacterium]
MTALFARERVPMVRMATLMLGSVELAEEIVQDTVHLAELHGGRPVLDSPAGQWRPGSGRCGGGGRCRDRAG